MIHITQQEADKYYRPLSPKELALNLNRAIAYTLTPDPEAPGWEEITYYGAGIIDPTNTPLNPHFIYVLVNPSIPGICKIGFTTTSVQQRVKEINSATGVITPWYPSFSYKCPNGPMLEEEIHNYLEDRGVRVNPNREGFSITTEEAKVVIENLGKKYQTIEENA